MSKPSSYIHSGATVLEESSETLFSDVADVMPEATTIRKSLQPVYPSESEIATLAYQLWLDKGCPDGSDQEDWHQAEAILSDALVSDFEALEEIPSASRYDTRTRSEIQFDLRWEGHWEVWESEWGGAHWTWDLIPPGVEVSNRAA